MRKTFFRRNTAVFQGKLARCTAKRPAVRVRWELEEYTLKNAPDPTVRGVIDAVPPCFSRNTGPRGPLTRSAVHTYFFRRGSSGARDLCACARLAPSAGSLTDAAADHSPSLPFPWTLYGFPAHLSSVFAFFSQDGAQIHLMAVLPQTLEVIEFSCLARKHMHNQTAEIHQHPRAAAVPFA